MKEWIIRKFGGIPKEKIGRYLECKPSREEMFYKAVNEAMNQSFGCHPEYRHTTLDKYFLSSFIKRFNGIWTRKLSEN